MQTANGDAWAAVGIHLTASQQQMPRWINLPCPKCQSFRSAQNRQAKTLGVQPVLGFYNCKHCQWKGNVFPRRSLRLADQQPVAPDPQAPRTFRYTPGMLSEQARAYLQARGIPLSVIRARQVGWSTVKMVGERRAALTFPYFDVTGQRCVNIKYRSLDKKFGKPGGGQASVYGLEMVKEQTVLAIVEGELDVLACDAAGVPIPVVSMPDGSSSVDNTLLGLAPVLQQLQRIFLAGDQDAAGEQAMQELARRLGPERCWRVTWPTGCKDANDTLMQHGADGVWQAIAAAQPWPVQGFVTVQSMTAQLDHVYEHGLQRGALLPWPKLRQLYSVKPGELTVISGIPGAGKALSLTTEIPTPTGWKTMADLQVGDLVFNERGETTPIIWTSEIMENRPCYELEFADGTTVICDEQHQWYTRDDKARRSRHNAALNNRVIDRPVHPKGADQRHKRTHAQVRTTKQIYKTLTVEKGKRANHAIPAAKPLRGSEQRVPIPPYTLGAWLGDGTTMDGSITCFDTEILQHIGHDGFTVSAQATRGRYTIRKLKPLLRQLGVLGYKHIPAVYLQSPAAVRLFLLQGLMDTDGYVGRQGQCEYTTVNRLLAEQLIELIRSLGIKAGLHIGRAVCNGKDCGEKYRIQFSTTVPVCRLPRKHQRLPRTIRETSQWHYVVRCTKVPAVPVRCIQVWNATGLFLCTRALIPTHNSTFLSAMICALAQSEGWHTLMFTPEHEPWRMSITQIEQYIGKPFDDMPNQQRMSQADYRRGRDWLHQHVTYLLPDPDEAKSTTVPALLDLARVGIHRHGSRILSLDPWNQLEHNRPANQTEREHISECLTLMLRFAKKYSVHIFIVAHPRKLDATKKGDRSRDPLPYDIAGAADWWNKTDNMLLLWTPAELEEVVTVSVAKVKFREVGRTGSAMLRFDRATGRFHGLISDEFAPA